MTNSGDAAQTRAIVDQVVEASFVVLADRMADKFQLKSKEAEIPAPLKWAGAIMAGLFTAGTATLVFWLVSSVSEMQVTLARMDERMASGTVKDARFDEIDRRVTTLERYHQGGVKQ